MSSFDAFKAAFKGDVVTPNDPDYHKVLVRWACNAERQAQMIALPKDAEDVSLAIKYAKSEPSLLPLAIKGGGHNVAGASSSEGLVIDLSRHLAGVRVDPVKKLGYVGGGAIWETVDKTAIEHGLATVGGTVNHTGVGGLTLGGGYGWLSGEHGLAMDSVIEVTMVVGDGTILTANSESNTDLFWAVRGGGGNFGVCTEFVFQLHDQRRTVYSGILIYPKSMVRALAEVTKIWVKSGLKPKEAMVQVFTRSPPPQNEPCVACLVFYNGSEKEGRENFKPFLDLKPIDHTMEMPYEKLNSLQNELVGYGRGAYLKGLNFVTLEPEHAETVLEKISELTANGKFIMGSVFEYFPHEKTVSVSNDATAMNNRTSQLNMLTHSMWEKNVPENTKIGRENVRAVVDYIASLQADVHTSRYRAYANYSGDLETTDRSAIMFGSNYPRLQELKKKFDPDCLFMKWYPIQPAA